MTLCWNDVIEELAARLTTAIKESPDKDFFEDDDLVVDFALGGIEEVRRWLLAQRPPEEDSESRIVDPPGSVLRSH